METAAHPRTLVEPRTFGMIFVTLTSSASLRSGVAKTFRYTTYRNAMADPIECKSCGQANTFSVCKCSRAFMLTSDHVAGRLREYETEPVAVPPEGVFDTCDFCHAKSIGRPPVETVSIGLRQMTCPSCHTAVLAKHGM